MTVMALMMPMCGVSAHPCKHFSHTAFEHLWMSVLAGLIFLPDSIGYVVGTNTFGLIAYRFGRYVGWFFRDVLQL